MDWKGFGLDIAGEGIKAAVSSLDTAAKLALNTLYPDEIEVYMVTLELVTHDDTPVEGCYFTFPINPDSINKSQPYVKQIDRTHGAVIVNKTGKFVPQDIVIKGTFGRQFRFITRDQSFDISAIQWLPGKEFNHNYKSGYGCFKIVQKICEEAEKLDKGYARKLYFHNLALGESYLVEVMNFTGSQTLATNMIWNYDLRMKILTNVLDQDKRGTFKNNAINSTVAAGVKAVGRAGRELVSNLLQKI